jgi:hypothetical protein
VSERSVRAGGIFSVVTISALMRWFRSVFCAQSSTFFVQKRPYDCPITIDA